MCVLHAIIISMVIIKPKKIELQMVMLSIQNPFTALSAPYVPLLI